MKVHFSSIASSKLKAASPEEQRAVGDVAERLSAATKGVGQRLAGVENAYQLRASADGPVLLYEVSEGVATVKGIITARQQEFGNVNNKRSIDSSRARSKKEGQRKAKEAKASEDRLPNFA